MLENIRFCYCSRLDFDEEKANQCMFFGFTKRAKKVLSDDFLFQITDTSPEENHNKSGIPLYVREINNGSKVFLTKVSENLYRIPTKYIDPFVRCLFKYVPAYYMNSDKNGSEYFCDLRDKNNKTSP